MLLRVWNKLPKSNISWGLVGIGVLVFVIGTVADVTIVGLPEGLGLDAIGVLLILAGAGVSLIGTSK